METIKSVLGLGTTAPQEGREPVSGVTGSGVAGEPYDQGNAEDSTLGGKAPQHTATTTDGTTTSSTEPYTIGSGLGSNSTSGVTSSDGVTPNTASATSSSGPAVDPTSSNTTSGPHSSDLANKADPRVDSDNDRTAGVGSTTSTTSGPHSSDAANKVDPRVDSDNSKTDSTGPIGGSSWMSTALPHREGNNTTSNTGVSGTTTQQSSHSQSKDSPVAGLEDIKSQPPNVLPTNVPAGTSTDFGAPDSTPAVTGTSSAAATSSVPSSSTNTTTDTPVGSSVPSTTEPSHSLTGSRDPIAPTKPDHTNSPLKPAEKGGSHGVNPDAIPLAGGKKIGEDAYTERKSLQVDSIDAGLPATTSSNTARNVGTAEATGRPSTTSEHEKSSVISGGSGSDHKKSSVTSGGSGSEHKEKKGLVEKIKEKVHIHKHDK